MVSTRTLRHSAEGIAEAGSLLRAGKLVAFPTETVYGLGADATNGAAVARVFEAKGRPRFNPLIVHVPDLAAAQRIGVFDPAAQRLAGAFWPGPLTLVVPLAPRHGLSPLVTAGLDTVALRVPRAALALDVLRAAAVPIAAPSANASGRISPTQAAHVLASLDGRIEAVLDGGGCDVGLESTILRADPLTLLREGGVSREAIAAIMGEMPAVETTPGKVQAPGQLASHYAPGARVVLDITTPHPDAILLGFGPVAGDLTLSAQGDLVEAAATLFDALHRADAFAQARGVTQIHVAPVPEEGLGRAILDRLRRAAAPRETNTDLS